MKFVVLHYYFEIRVVNKIIFVLTIYTFILGWFGEFAPVNK